MDVTRIAVTLISNEEVVISIRVAKRRLEVVVFDRRVNDADKDPAVLMRVFMSITGPAYIRERSVQLIDKLPKPALLD
ncbi:hypothetical protein C486_17255 [Natrinema gari JCM 14663]|uniref:Uncharacterized protein n=1 Tax=Natrinema gari JCM 14663 TaxID=1230459 RepID=L9YSV6_9EURY|nr:hypothetical protein C486_17255 [Natrinema gari JCM 14663]